MMIYVLRFKIVIFVQDDLTQMSHIFQHPTQETFCKFPVLKAKIPP